MAFLILLLGLLGEAVADEMDPFDVDGNSWMSLERFEDKESRFPSVDDASDEITSPPEMVVAPEVIENDPKDGAQQELTTEETQVVQPIRPLVLPVMPSLSQGFEVLVDTTTDDSEELPEEEKAPTEPSRPLNPPVMPGKNSVPTSTANSDSNTVPNKPIDEEQWKDAQTVAKGLAQGAAQTMFVPFNVRLTTRPDGHATATPGAPIIRPHALDPKTPTAGPTKQKAKAEEERKNKRENPEVCEALKVFRKKQLAAIESDHQTLKALQAAIAELGVDKQIDFSGKGEGLNAQTKAESPTAGKVQKNGTDASRDRPEPRSSLFRH